jgi:hypothetical protein
MKIPAFWFVMSVVWKTDTNPSEKLAASFFMVGRRR